MAAVGTDIVAITGDYTDLDYDAARVRLSNLQESGWPGLQTDRARQAFYNALMGQYAFILDVLAQLSNSQARQSRLLTADQRVAAIGLLKLLGYRPLGATAAVVTESITLADPPVDDVVIPAGTIIRTDRVSDPIRFQTLDDLTIAAGSNPPTATVDVENSDSQNEVFQSNGLPGQEFPLTYSPFLDGSAKPTAANGEYTTRDNLNRPITNFLNYGPTDRVCIERVDQNDVCTLVFGNGINGAIPAGTITVPYKTGGGSAGNVQPGAIKRLDISVTDAGGRPVTVTCTNPEQAGGGTDRQTIQQLQEQGPASLRVLERAVAREDFEIVALQVAGVARALMVTSDEDPSIQENAGFLFIVPVGGGAASQPLLDAVAAQFAEDGPFPCTLTFRLTVASATYFSIDVVTTVYMAQGAKAAVVRPALTKAVAGFFAIQNPDGTANTRVDFGAHFLDQDGAPAPEIVLSDLEDVIHDTPGVRKIADTTDGLSLNGERTSVAIPLRGFPVLRNLVIRDGNTGQPL